MPSFERKAITPWYESFFTLIRDVEFLSCHGRSQILFALVPRFFLAFFTKSLTNVEQVSLCSRVPKANDPWSQLYFR
jgi:hypothetical protein